MTGPISYIGGKNRLAQKIISLFPEHTTYVEAFTGGGQVFFHKTPSKVEVLNDLDSEVVNFFRICQGHHQELVRHLRYVLVSRRWYELFAQTPANILTDIQRAARFLYLQKNSFGGRVVRQSYSFHVVQKPGYSPAKIPHLIKQTHERLRAVQLECLPYEQALQKYDRPTTLFYLDPPYWGRQLYKFNFSASDFRDLARRLAALKGKFILSLNDLPEVRSLFSSFHLESLEIPYTSQVHAGRRYKELLITNYSTS